MRNLIFELTSYVNENNPISIELVQFVLARLRFIGATYFSDLSVRQLPFSDQCKPFLP